MNKLRQIIVSLISSLLFLHSGCEKAEDENAADYRDDKKISIVTTTTHVTDLVTRLVGDTCKIKSLMGPGVDPHSYKPTALDMTAISTADIVIYHGLKLEGKLASVLNKNASRRKTYAICSAVPDSLLIATNEDNSEYPDPHVWFSPDLWIRCLQGLSQYLIKEFPELKDKISERQTSIETEINQVSKWARSKMSAIPKEKRILITSHDAFRYLGNSFSIDVVALQGISTLQEAGLADRANLVDFINENKVPCLFIESSVNPKAIQEIAKETDTNLGDPLYSDALGNPDNKSAGPNQKLYPHNHWEGMFIHNINAILKGISH